ncbi:uncharacterized protein LOC135955392 [Calliphora vicina]|uniref:uncharacterized protein LOC135955392 n=1 Tax=Calliphora vicina TaxID=7373 RepID=UPI00325C319E
MNVKATLNILAVVLLTTSLKAFPNIVNIVKEINRNQGNEINVLINFQSNRKKSQHFEELLQLESVPKLIITQDSENITALYKVYNQQSLTIAWITETNLNSTLDLMDRLLWTIHFKDIILIYEMEHVVSTYDKNLFEIFSLCWKKGFKSLLLWQDNRFFTYHPYPTIKIVRVYSLAEYEDKSHLRNFHHTVMRSPIFEFPPMCFSYINHRGELLRVGYVYKWIETFFTHYNATYEYQFHDMWAHNVTYLDAFNTVMSMNFAYIPLILPPMEHYFARSSVMFLSSVVLIVPAPKEIFTGLYVIIPYNALVWFIVLLTALVYFLLVNMLNYLNNNSLDWGQAFQDAFNIIIFLSVSSRVTVKNYLLKFGLFLLLLFTGIFLTNYYSSNLSSLYTSKVYEQDLYYIEDIARTKLNILEYTADAPLWVQRDMSSTFLKRIVTGSNHELFHNRQILNMSYMYITLEEYADFLLFRQTYLKRPTAKKLNEPLYHRPIFITLPYRSPIIDQLNRYLLYLMDSGIFTKILADTKWHGILSGRLQLFLDKEENKALTLEYFYYVFIIWIFGLICAFLSFLCEICKWKLMNK